MDNQADSHRLRLLVPGQENEGFSVSDNQFGRIRRPVRDEAMDVWEKEDVYKRQVQGYNVTDRSGLMVLVRLLSEEFWQGYVEL